MLQPSTVVCSYHTVGFDVTDLVRSHDLQIRHFVLHAAIIQVIQTTHLLSVHSNDQLMTPADTWHITHSVGRSFRLSVNQSVNQ